MTNSTHDDIDPKCRADEARAPESGSTPDCAKTSPKTDERPGDGDPEQAPDATDPVAFQAELGELNNRFLRAMADLENARRRARLDLEDARAFGTRELLRELLPVLDALHRALESASPEDGGPLYEGIQLTEQQFQHVLARQGVTPVKAEPGMALDPDQHRALLDQPSDEFPPGTIMAVITRGYRLHDRLLREAEVVVARCPEAQDD